MEVREGDSRGGDGGTHRGGRGGGALRRGYVSPYERVIVEIYIYIHFFISSSAVSPLFPREYLYLQFSEIFKTERK